MGIDMLIPSGILWSAMAKEMGNPSFKFLELTIKVTIPSGILCSIKTIIDNNPTLYKLFLLFFFST